MLILTWIFRNGDWWWLFDVPVWYESVRCGQVFEHSIAGGGSRHQKKHRTLPALMWGDLVEASSWLPGHQRFGETWRSEHVFFFWGGAFFTRNTVEYCSMKIYASDRFSSPGPCGCGVSSREHSRRSKHSDIAGGQITRKDGMMMGCTK